MYTLTVSDHWVLAEITSKTKLGNMGIVRVLAIGDAVKDFVKDIVVNDLVFVSLNKVDGCYNDGRFQGLPERFILVKGSEIMCSATEV